QQEVDIGVVRQGRERFLAVTSEAEGKLLVADLAAETLPEQQLKIGLVIDGEDLRRGCHPGLPQAGSCGNCPISCFNKSNSTGLVMNSAAPCSLARRRRSPSPYAVTIMTGSSGHVFLISHSNASPSIPGILMSDRMTISSGLIPSASIRSASSAE